MAAIECQGVRKRFGKLTVLDGLDLAVPEGTLYGLIGLNGAGKTTTLSTILGLLRPDAGTCRVLGTDSSRIASLRGRVGAALHRPGIEPQLTILENLRLHALRHGRTGVRGPELLALLERLELTHLKDRRAAKLSQGERQRLALARAVLLRPDLLVLDEPLTHLDPGAVHGVLDFLTDEVRTRGATVLLSSHQLEHVERAAHRLAVLHEGRVLMEGTMLDLLTAGLGGRAEFLVGATPAEDALRVLRAHPLVADVVEAGSDGLLKIALREARPEVVNAALVAAGVRVALLRPVEVTLNDLFRKTVLARRGDAA
jgi:ABC-2 type transport system ATP-binding protein